MSLTDEQVNQLAGKFTSGISSDTASVLDMFLGTSTPKKDYSQLINRIGAFLCNGSPCPHHIKQAETILEMVNNFEKGK